MGVDEESRTTTTGIGWTLFSAAAIAFYYIWSAELTEKYGTLPVATWNMLAGPITILRVAMILGGLALAAANRPTPEAAIPHE